MVDNERSMRDSERGVYINCVTSERLVADRHAVTPVESVFIAG